MDRNNNHQSKKLIAKRNDPRFRSAFFRHWRCDREVGDEKKKEGKRTVKLISAIFTCRDGESKRSKSFDPWQNMRAKLNIRSWLLRFESCKYRISWWIATRPSMWILFHSFCNLYQHREMFSWILRKRVLYFCLNRIEVPSFICLKIFVSITLLYVYVLIINIYLISLRFN